VFDSQKEYHRWLVLKRLLAVGAISMLRRQRTYKLHAVGGQVLCRYRADATYLERGTFVVEDTKSEMTRKLPMYVLKKKWMLAEYGIRIRET
jgi:hypothetical protein